MGRVRGDRERGNAGTWGLGDAGSRGRGDSKTRGLGDVRTSGLGDAATHFRSIEFQKWENIPKKAKLLIYVILQK